MAKTFDGIDDRLAAWIAAQPAFFVATAPLAAEGFVNVSPKGLAGTFTVLAVGIIGLFAVRTGIYLYADIAITIALVAFLSTAAFARYLLSRGPR